MFGPDTKSSLTINQTKVLVQGIRTIQESIKNPINKDDIDKFSQLKNIFEKSLAVNQDLEIGDKIKEEHLEAKKPSGYGIPASRFKEVLGKKLVKDINAWEFLTEDYIK